MRASKIDQRSFQFSATSHLPKKVQGHKIYGCTCRLGAINKHSRDATAPSSVFPATAAAAPLPPPTADRDSGEALNACAQCALSLSLSLPLSPPLSPFSVSLQPSFTYAPAHKHCFCGILRILTSLHIRWLCNVQVLAR